MTTATRYKLVLFLGDVAVLTVSLWLSLLIRRLELPAGAGFLEHLQPFVVLFGLWCVVFFIAGLYERQTTLTQRELPRLLIKVQTINIGLAVIFFYTIPYFGLTPKTLLFIYLIVSFGLLLLWRLYGFRFLTPKRKIRAVIIGTGSETEELISELRENPYSNLEVVFTVDADSIDTMDVKTELLDRVLAEDLQMIVLDVNEPAVRPLLPELYKLIFADRYFFDIHTLYQTVFGQVPLSLLHYTWFLDNISALTNRRMYNGLSRAVDMTVAAVLLVTLLPPVILVALLIKLIDGGPVLYNHHRIGLNNQPFRLIKFQTMRPARYTGEDGESRITKLGRFLRVSRLDELPQLWNVLIGDLSLIGPRPEKPEFVEQYEKQIPFYRIRHLAKPGLSGWAQLYQKQPPKYFADVGQTKQKLAYDLYYLVNRSLLLDLSIALKTLKVIVSRNGS